MNCGQPQPWVLTDFEKREAELKAYEEEKQKKSEALQNNANLGGTRKIELVNRRKYKRRATYTVNVGRATQDFSSGDKLNSKAINAILKP